MQEGLSAIGVIPFIRRETPHQHASNTALWILRAPTLARVWSIERHAKRRPIHLRWKLIPDKSPTAAGRGDRSRKRSKGRLNTEVGLRSAIDRGEFFVEYQHLVSLCDNSIADVETLVRWEHPLRGRIGPHQLTPEITENSENSVTHDIELSISVFEGLRRWGAARTLGG